MTGFTHESSRNESIEWYTPPEVFKALDVVFDLDPCSPGEGKSFVPARRHLTIEDDGLATPWSEEDFVWLNPPYGSQTGQWLEKLDKHGNGIALVFARTDVQWFQRLFRPSRGSLISALFISGRIRFYQGNTETRGGTPGAGSMLLGFGPQADRVLFQAARKGLGAYMMR